MIIEAVSRRAFYGLFIMFFIGLSSVVWGEEEMCIFPTGTGNVNEPPGYQDTVVLKMGVNRDNLDEEGRLPVGGCASVWVESGGFGKPPYTLKILSGSFFFNYIGGPTEMGTDRDFHGMQLCAGHNACGSVGVLITDAEQKQATTFVRSTNGTWVFISHTCGYSEDISDSCTWNEVGWTGPGWLADIECTAIFQNKKQFQKLDFIGNRVGCESSWCRDVPTCDFRGYMGDGDNCLYFSYPYCLNYGCDGINSWCVRTEELDYYEWRCR